MKKVIYNNGPYFNLTGTILKERITKWGAIEYLIINHESVLCREIGYVTREWISSEQIMSIA